MMMFSQFVGTNDAIISSWKTSRSGDLFTNNPIIYDRNYVSLFIKDWKSSIIDPFLCTINGVEICYAGVIFQGHLV